MSMATLERSIRDEVRHIAKNRKIKVEDLMEWSSSDTIEPAVGEVKIACPINGVVACIKADLDKRPKEQASG